MVKIKKFWVKCFAQAFPAILRLFRNSSIALVYRFSKNLYISLLVCIDLVEFLAEWIFSSGCPFLP